jgi:hypothetical protein
LAGLARLFRFLDQLPEFARFPKLLVFGQWQFAAEKKIAKRVLVQDAMDFDAFIGLSEIDAVLFRAVAI